MKAASVLLTMLVLLAAACGSERSATVEETATAEVPTATVSATQTEVVPTTPIATVCPTVNPEEEAVREVLRQRGGEYQGETFGLSLVGCQIHGFLDYSMINQNPDIDQMNPFVEIPNWEYNNRLSNGILNRVIRWEMTEEPSPEVCQLLAPQGLRCSD